jgi:hypothetical protein
MAEFKSSTECEPMKSDPVVVVALGAVAENLKQSVGKEKYYLTTAIAYTNGLPHMGHGIFILYVSFQIFCIYNLNYFFLSF